MAMIPAGLTFQDLVGAPTTAKCRPEETSLGSPGVTPSSGARAETNQCNDDLRNGRRLRISLPAGVVRVFALTRRDALLLAYSIQDNGCAGAVADIPLRGAAPDGGRKCRVAVVKS